MAVAPKRRNGRAESAVESGPPPVAGMGGPREPRVIQWIALDGLPEMRARVWLNHGWRVRQELQTEDRERFLAAFAQVVLEHNGWEDAGGDPYPPASEAAAFWDAISTPLARTLFRSLYAEARALANFPTPTRATTDAG